MKQSDGYPKPVFVLLQCYLIREGDQEVVMHDYDVVLGMTRSSTTAEILLAKMKERSGDSTIRSTVQPMPAALLEMMSPAEESVPASLLEIAELTEQESADASLPHKE